MKTEDLLKMLADAGLDNEAMKALLGDALASLEGNAEKPMDEEEEKKQINELFGTNLK